MEGRAAVAVGELEGLVQDAVDGVLLRQGPLQVDLPRAPSVLGETPDDPLRTLAKKVAGDDELESLAAGALTELEGAIEDLRELARGLHPPLLAREGLAAALRAGATRSSVPVQLDLRLPARLPPALEAAAYYVCAEAATNTVKHARASQVWLTVAHENGTLTVVVRDDGVGGACIECGEDQATGLGGLKDRVEALGGVLDVVSPEGEGTLLTARFPVP